MKRTLMAWIKKYILHKGSPSVATLGYVYEWDYLKAKRYNLEEDRSLYCHGCITSFCSNCVHGIFYMGKDGSHFVCGVPEKGVFADE